MPPALQTAVNYVSWKRKEREFAAVSGEVRRKKWEESKEGRKEGRKAKVHLKLKAAG